MKKCLSIILTVCLMFTVMPFGVFDSTVSAKTSGYYTYYVLNGEATITGCNYLISGNVSIPSTFEGCPVTSISSYAFIDCIFTGVIIPNSVTSIGVSAFSGCSNLTSVTIPDSVTRIGSYAFSDCTNLISVTIPDGVTSIESSTFEYCTNLASITIPKGVTRIGPSAFEHCGSLANIKLSDSITEIGEDAFSKTAYYNNAANWENEVLYISNCLIEAKTSKSGTYTVKSGTNLIVDHAFENCGSITNITIPDSVTSIGSYAFRDCGNLTSVTIPDSIINIDGYAFYGCKSLKNVYITNIASWCNIAFEDYASNPLYYADNLYLNNKPVNDIVIPNDVTAIPTCAFSCDSLTNVTIPDSVTSIDEYAFYACDSLMSVTIPDSVTSIGYFAFGDCSSLTRVTIPNSVTSLGEWAFYDCTNLTSIKIPDSVTSIGERVFYDCTSLTNVIISDGVTSIGYSAFCGCSSLTSVTIPNSVTSIGEWAFGECDNLTDVYITDIAVWCNINFGNVYSNPLYYADNLYLNNKLVKDIIIPNDVTVIPTSAFSCDSLTNVTIPDSVTSIGSYAFRDCNSLTSVTIPDSVINIDGYAFYGCKSLTSITIPDSVTSMGTNAFYNCNRLKKLIIADGSKTVTSAIVVCKRQLTEIVIPNTVNYIGEKVFENCNNLMSITIPNSITVIEENTFNGCGALKKIYLPKDIILIKKYNFNTCSNLSEVYYGGNEADWKNIVILQNNDCLNNANIYYNSTEIKYNVTFKNYDGTVLSSKTYRYGDTVIVPPTPTKPSDNTYNYKFVAWDSEVENCNGDKIYTAVFKPIYIDYTITFKNYDGTVISTNDYHYGDKVTVPKSPTRNTINGVGYKFAGWDKTVVNCKGNATYTAKFTAYPYLLAPSKVSASLYGHDDIKVSWSKVTYADAYRVYYRKSSSKSYTYKGMITGTSMNFKDLDDNTTYYFKVMPCKKIGGEYVTDDSYKTTYLTTTRNLSAPSKVSATLYGHDDVKVNWSKVTNAKGYKIYYKTSSAKSYKYKGTTTKTYMNFANLSDGVKYYFKVVPCTYVNKTYFADDSYKTASIYTLKKVSTPKVAKYKSGKVKISWTNIAGESGYQISKSTSKSKTGTITTYATTSGKSKVISATKGKTYYYKVRAYKTVNGKKIYGPWSSVKAYKLK